MKTIILSINSRFIHTLLAPRYLKANCKNLNVDIIETNINIKLTDLLAQIYCGKPDVIAISCYIFNIEFVRKLLEEIKLVLPKVKIILGGYEVAFDVDRYLPYCDYIIKGEGDFAFNELLLDIQEGSNKYDKVIEAGTVKVLDDIATPFTEEYCKLGKEKILYIETSRGCPYSCTYCMSANTRSVRTFSLDRTFADLNLIMEHTPKQIKFVDRTFNFDIKRSTQIFEFIIDNFSNGNTNFHFEMAPELFDERMFSVLGRAKKGLIQFEIGVQSYNKETLNDVGRNANIEVIEQNILRLLSFHNIHIHLDLIAGLPLEDIESFKSGFDRVIMLKPNCLQLGFLKILKGSKIYYNKDGYTTYNSPPYEVISTPSLTFAEIMELKKVEEMLELYYNSERFCKSINFLLPKYFTPYSFFREIGEFFIKNGFEKKSFSAFYQCEMLYNFATQRFADNMDSKDYETITCTLENIINEDYKNSGNTRKWRRHI